MNSTRNTDGSVAHVSGFIYTRSEYNAKGQLTEQYQDAVWNTTPTAATLFEYDTMGNVSKKTLALAEAPDESNSPTEVYAYGAESLEDGIYSVRTRFNAAGAPLVSLQKQMISLFLPPLRANQFPSAKGT